jgi:hypothetical protein
VCVFLVHPEQAISLFLGVDKELAKGQVQKANRRILVVRNTKNRVQRIESALDLHLWDLKQAGK